MLLATEDNTVREEAAALLVKNTARVASERLAGTTPNGAPVYDKSETIDGHEIQTSATPPLRTLLSTPRSRRSSSSTSPRWRARGDLAG